MTSFISIPQRPDIQIAYRLERIPSGSSSSQLSSSDNGATTVWVVFLGGLLVPMASWDSVIALLEAGRQSCQKAVVINCLRYDRYGLAETKDRNSAHETKSHDLTDSVVELHQIIDAVILKHHATSSDTTTSTSTSLPPQIIFVGHSIGVVLARLYMNTYPGTISALLSVDTNPTNTDFVSIYPDPDSTTFNPTTDLPDGTTVADLRHLRTITELAFGPTQPNPESLNRSTVQTLLPSPSEPKLLGPDGKGPYVTVMSNDPAKLAEDMFKLFKASKELVLRYNVVSWREYNEGMLRLTDSDRAKGVVYADGSGHFIQTDRPDAVAGEIQGLVGRVLGT